MTIQEKCNSLNREIHNRLFLNNYLSITPGAYERAFTSIDLIEDCQDAIEEFESIPVNNCQSRSTLYIYGVLQSMYCQQDGLYNLYRTIKKEKIKNIYELFSKYNLNKEIREVRDDIAGHPTDRKNGREFYFIGKGTNSKYKFSYAGYTPHFRKVDVDLKKFIGAQNHFANLILDEISESISHLIQTHKNNFKSMKLSTIIDNLNYPTQLIYRGISNNHPLADSGLKEIKRKLDNLKAELAKRYGTDIPASINDIFRILYYIIGRIQNWLANQEIYNNLDAEVFMDSMGNQLSELAEILKEIDIEFEK
tara:strand:- start:5262 stop:6185 length:924 start_codon:yes stop_codon:yes gene_type:complete